MIRAASVPCSKMFGIDTRRSDNSRARRCYVPILLQFALFPILVTFVFLCMNMAGQGHQDVKSPQDLCYAFQDNKNIWTVCQGKREKIHVPSVLEIGQVTISADGLYLAYYADKKAQTPSKKPKEYLSLVSLRPGFETTTKESGNTTHALASTCGTILQFQTQEDSTAKPTGLRWSGTTEDLISAKALEFPPNELFKCSSDRGVIAEWRDSSDPSKRAGVLKLFVNNQEIKVEQNVRAVFQLSPNGRFLFFSRNVVQPNGGEYPQACLNEIGATTSCFADFVTPSDSYSVSDLGEVLYTVEIDKSCGEAGNCTGIGFWRPGMSKGEIIESLQDSFNPQWITPETAARLHEWAVTLKQDAKSSKN